MDLNKLEETARAMSDLDLLTAYGDVKQTLAKGDWDAANFQFAAVARNEILRRMK